MIPKQSVKRIKNQKRETTKKSFTVQEVLQRNINHPKE